VDLNSILVFVSPAQTPWLPDPGVQRVGMHVAWCVVLGSLAFALGARYQLRRPAWFAVLVFAWSLWPGPLSPSYWLGLAFQAPSLMSIVLCVIWTVRTSKLSQLKWLAAVPNEGSSWYLQLGGIFLGWVLLSDMLALWPTSIYAWGFGTPAVALACTLALILWRMGVARKDGQLFTLAFALVITLFVFTRLPSGNLCDALIDPWLWGVLQLKGLIFLNRRRNFKKRAPIATRV